MILLRQRVYSDGEAKGGGSRPLVAAASNGVSKILESSKNSKKESDPSRPSFWGAVKEAMWPSKEERYARGKSREEAKNIKRFMNSAKSGDPWAYISENYGAEDL